MVDYNTHRDFGSGDRICYHGVTDMFRNHKMAAAVYKSQGNYEIVLEISSSMDIGEHPASINGKVWIFTNADSVKMYKNGNFVKEYVPHNKHFPNMVKSPILIDDYLGKLLETEEKMPPNKARYIAKAVNFIALYGYPNITPMPTEMAQECLTLYNTTVDQIVGLYAKYVGNLGSQSTVYRFEAITDGKVVKTVTKTQMDKLSLKTQVSHTDLHEGATYDVSVARIRAVDENGNLLPYSNEAIKLTTEGPIEIIGPDMFALRGGMAGFYVKTIGEKGKGKVIISCPRVEDKIIDFEIN
jgi:beta-galactosidase